ncbi:MAG: 2-amino-4-hydroxy-6-hydroxymethyldihydropteridine diphosphokinase [Candidatus Eremiobacteraeota bacterium]|nr:2-amino-4-hydroxy-6-hydroxymethyldihydropteridine diphosphokinase [Candidatus Eremiobacteraeota bacterium]
MPLAYIGIGSNLDDPQTQVERAITALHDLGRIALQSSLYRTLPWGETAQPDFINAVVALETSLPPGELLSALQSLERQAGRVRDERRWGPRVLDLDLLLYGDAAIVTETLTVPHPRLFERAFVLAPLAEIDHRYAAPLNALPPDARHSVTKIADRRE